MVDIVLCWYMFSIKCIVRLFRSCFGLAATISGIGYLLFPSRDMAEKIAKATLIRKTTN